MPTPAFSLAECPAHLGLGATVVQEPRFTGPEWYAAYGARHASDGVEGRLVTMHTFAAAWPTWEMHPKGAELVVCVSGVLTLTQEIDDGTRQVTLRPGEAVINPPGVWHTADVEGTCTAFFVTAGEGTQVRPR